MSGGLTGRAARAALDYMTGTRLDLGVAAQTMQLALLTAAPPADPTIGRLNEVASTGYARQNVTWGLATTPVSGQPSQIANSSNLLYGPFTDINGLAYPATHCALIGAGVPSTTGNLLSANVSDIETDASGWSAWNSNTTKAQSTTVAKSGTASLSVTSAAAGNTLTATPNTVPVNAFSTYIATAWAYTGATGITAKIDLDFKDATGTSTGYKVVTAVTLPANTWTQITHTRQAPANSAAVQMLLSANALAASQIVFFDQMTLTETATQDVLMTWAFDSPGQAAQNESLQVSAGALTMSLG